MDLDQGTLLEGRFEVGEYVSRDESGEIYQGTDTTSGNRVNIKILSQDQGDSFDRFMRQVKLTTQLEHPNLLASITTGNEGDLLFLVTEHEEGITLDQYLADMGRIEEKEVIKLLMPVADVLNYAWGQNNIIHRNVKPGKIMMTDSNEIKLVDLGIAKSLNDSHDVTAIGMTVGTPNYMSPELAKGDDNIDFHSDMYGFGLVMYELLTGKQAFPGDNAMEVLGAQLNEYPPYVTDVVPAVTNDCSNMVQKLLEKEPENRFASWEEIITEMGRILDIEDAQPYEPEEEEAESSGLEVDEITPGTIIGSGNEIDRKVGEGAMGDIYLAFSEEFEKLVQVKILPAHMNHDHERVSRFLREIEFTKSLNHPNLLSVIEAGEDMGRYFLVTDYEPGITFYDYIGRYGPVDEKEAVKFIMAIAEVLRYAWDEKKLLHRDIKPQNIIIRDDKEVRLADFGITKSLDNTDDMNLTGQGFSIGTPDYMSPEQVMGADDLDFRTDMYSIGILLFEALTKEKPFKDESIIGLMQKQMNEPHPPVNSKNPAVSKACCDLVDKLLSKNKEDRYASYGELIHAMKGVIEGAPAEPAAAKPKAEKKEAAAPKKEEKPEMFSPKVQEEEKGGPNMGLIIGGIVVLIIIIAVLLGR